MSELAQVTRHAARGMITFRGDLAAAKVKKMVKDVTGQTMPKAGEMRGTGDTGVAWMSPDELLLMVAYDDVAATLDKIASALPGVHHLAVDVSDARAVFTLQGPDARQVLSRLCPVDLHADSFELGQFRRTRMAQIAAAFWCHDGGFDVVCFRSVGDYAERLLRNAATGAPVPVLG